MHHSLFATIGSAFALLSSIGWAQTPNSSSGTDGTWPTCANVPRAFTEHVHDVLADSAGLFKGDYPDAAPLTCELLDGLREAMTDDSVRYHFEHLSQRYWTRDDHYHDAERFIQRHLDFHLAIAATAHFFEDIRIMGLKQLRDYRRMRPMVCATKEHYAKLEEQDRQAVRYLLNVLDHTSWIISGSENATIHRVYISEIARTLDLFTGQEHIDPKDLRQNLPLTDETLRAAIPEWRKWLDR